MPLLPLKIPSDFPDPALTLAVTPGSQGIGNCLTISLILSLSVRLRANPETALTRPDHLTEMSVVVKQCISQCVSQCNSSVLIE